MRRTGRRRVAFAVAAAAGVVTAGPVTASAATPEPAAAIVVVDRDDVVVSGSVLVQFTGVPIVDADGDGVLHIEGDGSVVRLLGTLRGAAESTAPEDIQGIGIRVRGRDVSIAGGRIEGFRVGLEARGTDGLAIVETRFDGGFRQRLASTPEAEAAGDWLRPHENDAGEWAARYGAALRVTDARDVSIRDVTVRRWQNGLMLERVTDSVVADCDASFLSGWGLAMWRVERTLVARNAFDFCIRGYSHGVYNRGQDSAGILMFEQCSDNRILRNSATHGGDGLFAFSGIEALGQATPPAAADRSAEWFAGCGHRGNLIAENDFSHAAAHGLELTFAFDTRIHANRLLGNAICGIWGGYSRGLVIDGNRLEANGDAGYGLERGGINIEHGIANRILDNDFVANACGVHLWNDDPDPFAATAWGQANGTRGRDSVVLGNRFRRDAPAVHLRSAGRLTMAGNRFDAVEEPLRADAGSLAELSRALPEDPAAPPPVDVDAILRTAGLGPGRDPRGARGARGGREAIILGPHGPWDHEGLVLQRLQRTDLYDEWRILGPDGVVDPRSLGERLGVSGDVRISRKAGSFAVLPEVQPVVSPYELRLQVPGRPDLLARGTVRRSQWDGLVFPWRNDQVTDLDGWRADASRFGVPFRRFGLLLPFGDTGPSDGLLGPLRRDSGIAADRFGLIASSELEFPSGRWRLIVRSDDGVRVLMDGVVVLEDWSVHAAREQVHEFTVERMRRIPVEVEYFEQTGFATLDVDFAWVGPLEPAPEADAQP